MIALIQILNSKEHYLARKTIYNFNIICHLLFNSSGNSCFLKATPNIPFLLSLPDHTVMNMPLGCTLSHSVRVHFSTFFHCLASICPSWQIRTQSTSFSLVKIGLFCMIEG